MQEAEREFAALLERRADEAREARQDERLAEAWAASERRERDRIRRENRARWADYFERLGAAHRAIGRDFERRAALLQRGEG